jgi:hypothetical protein
MKHLSKNTDSIKLVRKRQFPVPDTSPEPEETTVVRSDRKTTWNMFKLSAERNEKHSWLLFGKFNPRQQE